MTTESYEELVDEAFIRPIRSVLIVDDDYPTFEEILSDAENPDKGWRRDRARIKELITSLRGAGRNLLIDIHDGANVGGATELDQAHHLHQSDLLVLDYQLDRSKPGDGTVALRIIRRLMANAHFNLVVVHTSENIDVVYKEVLLGMLPAIQTGIDEAKRIKAEELIAEQDDVDAGFHNRITDSIDVQQYLEFRAHGLEKCFGMVVSEKQPFGAFAECGKSARWDRDSLRLVLEYLLFDADRRLCPPSPEAQAAEVTWSSSDVMWVRSPSVFVAFASKREHAFPVDELRAALANWKPDPSRLYLAKLRHEIDDRGTAEQAALLENRYALAGWYSSMLSADAQNVRRQIERTLSRVVESYMAPAIDAVAQYAKKIVDFDKKKGDNIAVCKEYYKINLASPTEHERAICQHNAVVNTKSCEGWHLTTGHVFQYDEQYWVCASPACDMVPGQLSAFRRTSFPDCMPFAAIQLQPVKIGSALAKANSTRLVFLDEAGEVKAYCFNDPSNDASAPHWTVLYATNSGKFAHNTFDFEIINLGPGANGLELTRKMARVVSQMRYEYALNLVQRLGVSLTRIGLDYQKA